MDFRKPLLILILLTLTLGLTAISVTSYESDTGDDSNGNGNGGSDEIEADFTYSPEEPDTSDSIEFDASDSYSDFGSIEEYRWDFDDGNTETSSSSTTEHSYDSYGSYTVELTIEDSEGNTDTETSVIEVGRATNLIYDLQASWMFEQGSPDSTGPSTFLGSLVVREDSEGFVEENEDTGEEGLNENLEAYYVEDSDDEWGGGLLESTSIEGDNWYLSEEGRDGIPTLITPPHPHGDGEHNCGDSNQNWGDEFDCPEDYGLPANEYSSDGTTEAETTTTDNLGDYSVETGRSTHTDEVNYELDLIATEPHSEATPDGVASEDISNHDSSSSTDSKTYYTDHSTGQISNNDESFEWQNTPDFYLESENELYTVFPFIEESAEHIFSVTNYYTRRTGDYDTWEGESASHSRCGDGDFENATCSSESASETICVATDEDRTMEDQNARTTSDDSPPRETVTTYEYTLSESGSNSYSIDSSSNDLTIEVDRDVARPTSEFHDIDWVDCDETSSTEESCEPTSTGEEHGYNCPSDTSVTGPTETEESYREIHSENFDFYHETIDFDTRKIFDTNIEDYEDISNEVSTNSIQALFDITDSDGNPIKGGFDEDDITHQVESGRAYYSYQVDQPSQQQGNSPSVSVSSFNLDTENNEFISVRDSFETYNVDGPEGFGDGYVAIRHEIENEGTPNEEKSSDWSIAGTSTDFAETETSTDGEDFVDTAQIESMMKNRDIECPGDQLYCVSSVSLYLDNLNNWGSTDPSDGVNFDIVNDNPYSTSSSLGVCKQYRELEGEDHDLDQAENVQCSYEYDPCENDPDCEPETDSEVPEAHVSGTRWHTMEGPSVDEEAMQFHDSDTVQDHREAYVEHSECVLHGEAVEEGTVANVAHEGFENYPGYEAGGDSPDWEVCLNINDNSDYHEFGGQWYDLDNPVVGEYLRGDMTGEGEGTSLVEDADTSVFEPENTYPDDDRGHISEYWLENPNPSHDQYNPMGGMEGTALLADCGPGLVGCGDDRGTVRGGVNSDPGFFASFIENSRDEDYHPQTENQTTSIEPQLEGVLNMIQKYPDNNQLSPGHYDYEVYFDEDERNEFLSGEDNSYEWYSDTETGEDEAVQYAYAEDERWVVDSTGVPYPPWGVSVSGTYASSSSGIHYREDYSGAERSSDTTVQKTDRAFGNSLAVVATSNVGNGIEEGEGFWIDPDNVRYHWEEGHIDGTEGANTWRDLVSFSIDLTGPDSGLGWDYTEDPYYTSTRDPNNIDFQDSGQVVYTDIYWEGADTGGIEDPLQPPMCGDDRYEYLLEEIGESVNSEQNEGRYACSTRVDQCVYRGSGGENLYPTIHSEDGGDVSYENTQEDGEDFGRLKNDEAVCAQRPEDDVAHWYDQDYSREIRGDRLCRENTLYGDNGKRWFDYDYIEEHPEAVKGGIDDSWNERMDQRDQPYLISDPDSGELTDTHTPIPTGSHHDRVAIPTDGNNNPDLEAYGFCGGDDEGEHLVTQEASTDLAETNRDVIGVASSSDYCIFDGEESQYTPEDSSQQQRQLYEPGETIDFGGPGSISCYDGTWYDTWPIVFDEVSIEVPFENRRITGFSVINPDDIERTFEVEMSEEFSDSVYTFSEFREETGTSFDVTVPPQSSENFNVIIRGEDNRIENEDLVLTAESSDGEVRGEDSLEVTVSEDFESDEVIQGEPESVSGIGFMQIAVLTLSALMLFFLQS